MPSLAPNKTNNNRMGKNTKKRGQKADYSTPVLQKPLKEKFAHPRKQNIHYY